MAMDAKEKKKLFIRIGAGVFIVLLLAFMMFFMFGKSGEDEVAVSNLGPSDSMIPADPATVQVSTGGSLIANPTAINFTPGTTTQTLTLMAAGSPITIDGAAIGTEYVDHFTAENLDCPVGGQVLQPGSSCTINITWTGQTSVGTTIEITGKTVTGSTPEPISIIIPINAIGGPNVIDGSPVDSVPSQGGVTATNGTEPTYVPVPEQAQPSQASLQEQRRDAYLNGRRQTQLNGFGPPQLTASAKSSYSSWSNVGAQGTTSSFPTDMSRVITPDKPITAVISVPIDTRSAVTAVAMVDRDVYGNNGRTVVIPRGSKIIGQVNSATERVGIAWSQLIRPDGVRFVFEGNSGDAMGRGGIPGKVNERNLRRYGYSLLPPAVAAAITVGLGGNSTSQIDNGGVTQQKDARSVAAEILSTPMNQIAQDIFQRNSAIPVQITVAAGTRITVWSIGDLRLKPVGEKDTVEQTATNRRSFTERQNVELPNGQQGNGISSTSSGQKTQNRSSGQTEGSEDINSYQVGSVDANGNYIPAGTSAPVPTQAPLSQQQRSKAPANKNPWQN